MKPVCAFVIPCYNEEEIIASSHQQLSAYLGSLVKKGKISNKSYLLYVNDGSKDKTWQILKDIYKNEDNVRCLALTNNRGHQNALFAGLMQAKLDADFTISLDADLQDDINVIEEMVDYYLNGYNIVYGVRKQRKTDSFFKRFSAESFYKLMNLMGAKSVYNAADFRLMDKQSLEGLSYYEEDFLFLRGIVPELGYKTAKVYYDRKARLAGVSKYPLKKMIAFAFNGITSFSVKPLTLILYIGILAIIISLLAVIYALFRYLNNETITGWSSLFISIWFLGGVQLVSLGINSQYVGKTFIESKKRPRYLIGEYLVKTKKVNKKETTKKKAE